MSKHETTDEILESIRRIIEDEADAGRPASADDGYMLVAVPNLSLPVEEHVEARRSGGRWTLRVCFSDAAHAVEAVGLAHGRRYVVVERDGDGVLLQRVFGGGMN